MKEVHLAVAFGRSCASVLRAVSPDLGFRARGFEFFSEGVGWVQSALFLCASAPAAVLVVAPAVDVAVV